MQPHQFSYPEQEQIYNRLNTLVGRGAAVFYKDAYRLMTMDTPLESTTHLVGHLLREIESSLRDVLKPILDKTTSKKGSGCENHKNEILAALKTLGISETSPVAEIWLNLSGRESEDGLHKRAHREDLAPPRVIDEEFEDFWRRIHILLDTVLDQFETRAAEIRLKLDELLTRSTPTEQNIKFLRLNILNSPFALGYFLDHLESSEWLKPLLENGFFSNPPDIENDAESKTYRFPVWAQSHYLIKAASYKPELVLEIAIQLMDTGSDNILIYEDLAEAALKMPPELAARWVEKAIEWLKQQPYLHQYIRLPDNLSKLLTYLASGNQADTALELARELLVILPQDTESALYIEPKIRYNEYYYAKIIEEYLSLLTEQQPHKVLELFCDLLDRYLSLPYSIREDPISEDYSYVWSPTIDSTSWNQHGINSLLAVSIWDIAKQILEQDPTQAKNLCQKFQSYRWRIFDRISLYAMLHFPEQSQDLIIERLLDRDRIEYLLRESFYSREHAQLLQEQFPNLPTTAQNQIFRWLVESPVYILEVATEKRDEYIKHWQRDWLSVISDYLSPELKQLYHQLVQELGSADNTSTLQGNLSHPKSEKELVEMAEGDMNALFTYFKEWPQSQSNLPWALVITPNAQKFVIEIERFKELGSQFTVWLLRGLEQALKKYEGEQEVFSWEPVLAFCIWILENFKGICDRSSSNEWSRLCDAVVSLIDAGFLARGLNKIPLTLRDQVWQILECLTNDPHVTPGFAPHYQGTNMGAYGASINTVRGKAMHAVICYALWFRQDANGNAAASKDFHDIPEVQQALEQHLDPKQDPSLVIRAVYGRWFPHLFYLASDWTFRQIGRIFPEDPSSQELFESAWEGYILCNQLYDDVFTILRSKYSHVIEQLSDKNPTSRELLNAGNGLSDHLLNLFWDKLIDLDEPDNLLERFFANAYPYLRDEFMRQISWRLLYGKFEVNEDLRERLQKFLDWRITQAKGANFKFEQISDLKYFSWWFASGKLDSQWAMARLIDVLKILGTVDYLCPQFLEHLESLSFEIPQDAVQCLSLMANGREAPEGFRSYLSNHHRAILQAVLKNGDEVAQETAKNLINRLLARNLGDYRELLS